MKISVLVVEDDAFIRMDAVEIVQSAGYEVFEAANADEAIVRLEQYPAIAIVLTDVEMPGSMNGIQLAFAIRDRWPPIHVIVVSGRMRPGADELPEYVPFIAKPYQPAQIEAALRAAA
ncbi:response regulator [Bosea sp. BK604]|uniref:response regulator n=1 Tax=Bosea sp. BK604 TaxID=2512180 RepID=UPI0010500251|nr:response regulator [Bosea sp. BK604]TCR63088.1 response regulator receiver domain-containing protein [Bosea sp. BK604]